MGSKNRIFLGIITSQILHIYRNVFNGNKLVVSKKKSQKIRKEHPQQSKYIDECKFQELLDKTIASCVYKQDGINNFISYNDESYLIYGISVNNFYNELSTVFKPSIRQLVKCKDSMKFFNEKDKIELDKYIKN